MFGECHAHIFLNGRNYKEAVALHKNHVSEEAIRQAFAEYRKRGITFVRDGGDALHVSEYASKIAPQYGIDYRSPMFAIHRKGHYGRIVGCAWEDLEEYRDLVKKVKDIPCAVGFGISTPDQAARMAGLSDGAIVGSAIVKLCKEYGADAPDQVKAYVKDMCEAVHRK